MELVHRTNAPGISRKITLCFMMQSRDHAFLQKMFTPDYVQGYTAALLDVRDVFGSIKDDLKIHKRKQNLKTICQILFLLIAPPIVS